MNLLAASHDSRSLATQVYPSAPRQAALSSLRWIHLRLTHQLQEPLTLQAPFSLGALYRSVWGRALHQHSSAAFELCFGSNDEALRPWWWSPPDIGAQTHLPAGTQLSSRLTLQEPLWPYLGDCVQALTDFSQYGLGAERTPAPLTQVHLWGPQGLQSLNNVQHESAHWQADQVWQTAQQEYQAQAVEFADMQVQAFTPLRLKEQGRLLHSPPALHSWVQRCMGRVQMLLPPDSGALMAPQDKHVWLEQCSTVTAKNIELELVKVPRYSARQDSVMAIEGICGRWSYPANALAAWPWLRLAEHLQLGGKTTLGFGALRLAWGPARKTTRLRH